MLGVNQKKTKWMDPTWNKTTHTGWMLQNQDKRKTGKNLENGNLFLRKNQFSLRVIGERDSVAINIIVSVPYYILFGNETLNNIM